MGEIGLMTSLQFVSFGNQNQLTGPIPQEIAQLSQLVFLDIEKTSLTGTIPSSICEFESLTSIYVTCDNVTCTCGELICQYEDSTSSVSKTGTVRGSPDKDLFA